MHPQYTEQPPRTKRYLARIVHGVEVEKPCYTGCFLGSGYGLCVSFSSVFLFLIKYANKRKATKYIHNKLPRKENPRSTLPAKRREKKKSKCPRGTS